MREIEKNSNFTETAKQFALIGGLFFAACLLGAAIIGVGGGAHSQTLMLGALVFFALGAAVCFALELPVMAAARFVFIFSFFFKAEVNFYKIDEVEDPSGFNLSLTLLMALILLVHDQFADKSREKIFPTSFSILLLALFGCAVISVLFNGSNLLGWFSVWSFLTSVLVAFAIASHFSQRERLIELITGLAVGLLFTGIISSTQYALDFPTNLAFFGTGTEEELLGTQAQILSRVQAFLRTPTEMAWVISTLIPLVIAPIVCRVKNFETWQKILLPAAMFLGIIAVILSLARGSWISLVVGIAILVLFGWWRISKSERTNYFVSVGGAGLLVCVLLLPFSARIYERLTADDDGSALIRLPLMETAVRIIEDNALVGVGLNNYRTAMPKYDETSIFVTKVFPNPVHNVFAHITAEIGIPGGIIFCLLIIVALFECFKAMTNHDRLLFAVALGTAAGLLAFIISAIKEPGSLGSGRPPLRTLFFMFGTILAISRMRRQLFL